MSEFDSVVQAAMKLELNDEIQHYTQLISQKLGDIVYGYDDSSLEQEILTLAI